MVGRSRGYGHTAESKRRLLAKCNASRRRIVNFFRNLSKYRLKKGQNVQFMSHKGVHGTIVHLTNLYGIYMEKFNTFLRLVKKVLVPYPKNGHDSIQMLFF